MKPKLFILLALLTVFSFTTKAQSLTFEQTREYIGNFCNTTADLIARNTPTKACGSRTYDNVDSVSIDKSGRVAFCRKSYLPHVMASLNSFDIAKGVWETGAKYADGSDVCSFKHLCLYDKNDKLLLFFCGLTSADGDRLYKAIWHLKDVCNKDPFGN